LMPHVGHSSSPQRSRLVAETRRARRPLYLAPAEIIQASRISGAGKSPSRGPSLFASLLLQHGREPTPLQRQLGHSSIQLTVDAYGRWLPMGNKAAVDRLDNGTFGTTPPGGWQRGRNRDRDGGAARNPLIALVGPPGFEPGTDGL